MEKGNYIPLDDLEIYQLAMEIGELIWNVVIKWDYFAKKTIGSQIVSSADSIAANISEGYGRYYFKDSRQFYFYSRGSILETKTWLIKAKNRSLLNETDFNQLIEQLRILHFKLNAFIKSQKKKL